MVLLTVKGQLNPDEFTFETTVNKNCGELAMELGKLLNMRHKIKLQLHSAAQLVSAAHRAKPELGPAFETRVQFFQAYIKETRQPTTLVFAESAWTELRDFAVSLFPSECVHSDGPQAAVENLYAMHENPELDEDYRLHVYHCRAMLDPDYRSNEMYMVDKCQAWFASKVMDPTFTLGQLCGTNEKSRVTVKIAQLPASGSVLVPPASEPRMGYADQRALRQHIVAKQETLKTLEESELRDLVVKQSRGAMVLPTDVPRRAQDVRITTGRHIHDKSTVVTVEGE